MSRFHVTDNTHYSPYSRLPTTIHHHISQSFKPAFPVHHYPFGGRFVDDDGEEDVDMDESEVLSFTAYDAYAFHEGRCYYFYKWET